MLVCGASVAQASADREKLRVGPVEDGRTAGLDVAKAAAALRWWSSAGVTGAVDETPHNRFDEANQATSRKTPTDAPAAVAQAALPPQRPAAQSISPPVAEAAAQVLAASSSDLDNLRANLEIFEGCSLKKTATQLVFSDGAPGSRVMLVGEAPGGDEDRVGRPFVGRAGQLLDRMLHSIGLDRQQVYIANVVPWRPPGNRTPTQQETQACLPFIRRQIDLAGPEILVCLGASAAQTLLSLRDGITRVRGNWFTYECESGRVIRAIAMFHPAFLLRQPGQKRQAWTDMRALATVLASLEAK